MITTKILLFTLTLIGVSEPVGVIASLPRLRALGRLSAASNCPLVFNDVGGVEFWANQYRIEFHDRSGAMSELPVSREVVSRIRGPHTRRAAYVVPIGLGVLVGPDFYLSPLRFGLCHHGPLAQDLGYSGDLALAAIHVRSGRPHDPREWTLVVKCPD